MWNQHINLQCSRFSKGTDQNIIFAACFKSGSLLKTHRPKIEIPLSFRGFWSLSWGTRWRSRKAAGSISDGVIIFHWPNPSDPTLALVATQPLTEMNTRIISWGVKEADAYSWQPYHLHVPIILKSGSLNLLELSGQVQACTGVALPFWSPS
jgi:hypothetical protein